ncbi:MAG: glycosyltransferase family 4 protein [Candidatus Poribacteria bacterium]
MFFVEGFTDIRFVKGLSEICDLTLVVPLRHYIVSGLKERIGLSNAKLKVVKIEGGRLGFQTRSLVYLWRQAKNFDVILAQEVLRGAINANIVGTIKHVPVLTYMAISPVEYYRCRYERKQISWPKAIIGEMAIKAMMSINGRLATSCLVLGPYLVDISSDYCKRNRQVLYFGVDTEFFKPIAKEETKKIREKLKLPSDKFIIFLSSRISHEKDPETVIRATAIARSRGLDAVVINLSGGYKEFLLLANNLGFKNTETWIYARPAAHPLIDLNEYYQAADVVAQASLAEGLGLSPLEALACGIPVVATRVGGMSVHLDNYARMTPKGDPDAMAKEFVWIAANSETARRQALVGREYVVREWNSRKAFKELQNIFNETVSENKSGKAL